MHLFLISSFVLAAFLKESSAFINGFPKERCDDMDPTKIKLEGAGKGAAGTANDNETDFTSEDTPPTSVRLSDSLNLYRIVTSAPKYRRGRTLDITIRGPDFNALMLQVRKVGADERRGFDQIERVGEFVQLPPSLQGVHCDKGQASAVTNKNYSPKSGLTVKWKAPKDDVGEVHVVARFVAGDEYWQTTESRELPMNEFPVNLKNCGKAKSCILYSEKNPSCHEDDCDYILTYSVVNNTSVEFVLGGTAEGDQTYLGIGFSPTPEAEKLKLIACTRAKTSAEIRLFENTVEDGMMEYPMHMENKKMDLDGDRMWCSFVIPMVTLPAQEGQGLDLSVPFFHAYMRGQTNNTRSSNFPVLPTKLLMSKKEIQLEKIKLQYHTMEKPKAQNSGSDTLSHSVSIFAYVAVAIRLWRSKMNIP